MKRETSSFAKRSHHGTAALIAIITMIVLLILGLAGATLSMNARLMSSHKLRESGVRALAEAGVDYGYWQFIWNRTTLPYNETNRTCGEGSFSVQVTDNSASVTDTIKVTSTATLRGTTYATTRVFRSDQQTNTYSINPASTFLYFPDYGAVDALRVKLKSLDIHKGDTIRLIIHGHWGPPENAYSSSATAFVFSENDTLLPPGSRARVPKAVAAIAPAYVSSSKSGTASDIPEDFSVSTTLDVVVPDKAKYLFTGIDYQQAVNISSDNFSVEIKKISDGGHAADDP